MLGGGIFFNVSNDGIYTDETIIGGGLLRFGGGLCIEYSISVLSEIDFWITKEL